MKKRFDKVYQFKITLKGIKPPIWRRIQVPETYTFWDLHVAIQDAMGWEDYHLHEFEMRHPSTGENVRMGTPTEEAEFFGQEIISEHHQKIADWFSMENRIANYTTPMILEITGSIRYNWKRYFLETKTLNILHVSLGKGHAHLRIVEESGAMKNS